MRQSRTQRPQNTKLPVGSRSIASSRAILLAQSISDASDGVDQLVASWRVDLGAELANEHIESIAFNVAFMAPRGFNHAGACNHAARISDEQIEKHELGSSERDD